MSKKTEEEKIQIHAMGRRQRIRLVKKFTKPSLTQQQFKDDAIIRNVIGKYDSQDLFKLAEQARVMTGGDYTEIDEFDVARGKVQAAEAWFHKLPSFIRRKFNDDPGTAIEFMSNPANADELVNLGLREAPLPPAVDPTPAPDASQKPADKPKTPEATPPTPDAPEA